MLYTQFNQILKMNGLTQSVLCRLQTKLKHNTNSESILMSQF